MRRGPSDDSHVQAVPVRAAVKVSRLMPGHLDPAYIAGIIDGEGSIFTRNRNPVVSVSNTSEDLIIRLALIGGYTQRRDPRRGLGTRPSWDWAVTGEAAAIVLRACLPYFVIKVDKARSALVEWQTVTGSNHGHFMEKARREMAERGWPGVRWRDLWNEFGS